MSKRTHYAEGTSSREEQTPGRDKQRSEELWETFERNHDGT